MNIKLDFTSERERAIVNGNGSERVSISAERWQQMLSNTIKKFKAELEKSETIEREKILNKLTKLDEFIKQTSIQIKPRSKETENELEDTYIKIADRLLESEDIESIFQIITKELRESLECDRVAIFRFNPDWTGKFIAESVATGWDSILEKQQEHPQIIQNVRSCSLRDLAGFKNTEEADRNPRETNNYGSYFTRGETYRVVNDIHKKGLPDSYIKIMELYQVKAYIIVAIYQGEQLWGLLAAYQNSGPRKWQKQEVNKAIKLANFFGLALQQSDYVEKIQRQKEKLQEQAEIDKTLTKILDRIRQSQDLQATFNINTSDIRQLLKCDRVGVYQFNPDYTGQIIAESVGREWVSLLQEQRNSNEIVANINGCSVRDLAEKYEGNQAKKIKLNSDTYLMETNGGNFNFGELYVVQNDIYKANFSQCYIQALEKYQARAYIIVAIYQNRKLWGLLAAYQNSGPREWTANEVELMVRIANQFSIAIQQAAYLKQIEASNQEFKRRAEEESTLTKIGDRIRESKDINGIFNIVTSELRRLLKCDRAAIYRFNEDGGGKFIAESVGSKWVSVLEQKNIYSPTADNYFQKLLNKGYVSAGNIYQVQNDIYSEEVEEFYLECLEAFQARAYIAVAIYQERKLWGLLTVYQNDEPRVWQEREIQLLVKIAERFSLGVQQAKYVKQLEAKNTEISQIAEGEKAIARLVEQLAEKITQARSLQEIFKCTVTEIRLLIKCDRVAIYQFDEDWSGEFIAESVNDQWPGLVGPDVKTIWEDSYLQETKGGCYARKEISAIDDICKAEHSLCHLKVYEMLQIRAYAIAPIFVNNKLWGLLAAYQNDGPRHWQAIEVQLLVKLAVQVGVAILQSNYLQELKLKNDRLEQNVKEGEITVQIIEKIRQSQDLNSIFRNTLNDCRKVIQCDRVAVYRFNPDFSGEFIAESVDRKWVSLVALQELDNVLKTELTDSSVCTVKEYGSPANLDPDTYLQETQGGMYVRGRRYRQVDDIYNEGFSDCYINTLEKYQAKAYINVPIFKGKQLWGLLAAYDNKGPRKWQEQEVQLMTKLGANYSVAVQEIAYLQDALDKNQKLARLVANETANARFFSSLPSTLVNLAKDDSSNINEILQFTVNELRKLLKCDRVGVYRFDPDFGGEFVVESVSGKWPQLVGLPQGRIVDTYLQENKGGRYVKKETLQIDNIYTAGHNECYLNLVEGWGTKAYVIAPIFAGEKLWGLLGVYQNSDIRNWERAEVNVITQTGIQIGVAIALAEALTRVRSQEQQLIEVARREKEAKEKLQQGALVLLRSIEPSFSGDLTVSAPLSDEEAIGTIADAFNTTISSLRDLVARVQTASERVSQTSQHNSSSVTQLSTKAREQVYQLKKALSELQLMVASTKTVVADAQLVEMAVQEANKTVNTGDNLMEKTVDGILEIRNTVSQTAKKIKRLGEASQKISKVVNLIEKFATQTNILALNAAIEATRAGEYGKGFAVVADEVRSLAYQSANATTEIGRIVAEIQGETKEVTEAMEIGIAQVVQGTDLVNKTRSSLSEIVAATDRISSLVTNITSTAYSQSNQSHKLTEAMNQVASIARQTSENATVISDSFSELLSTSEELQTSVSQFKVD